MRKTLLIVSVAALLAALPAAAVSILQMNLEDLCHRSDKIFRGTVVDIETGSVVAGGAELPTITYTVEVDEAFKGVPQDKGLVTIQMFGSKSEVEPIGGGIGKFPLLAGQPVLQVGRDYLLFTTQPSAIGLSTTVGLGHGCFNVFELDKAEMVINELNNANVFEGISGMPSTGPVDYQAMADLLNQMLGQ